MGFPRLLQLFLVFLVAGATVAVPGLFSNDQAEACIRATEECREAVMAESSDVHIESQLEGDSQQSMGTEADSQQSMGTGEASQQSMGTGEASQQSMGTGEASQQSMGTGEASQQSMGTGEASQQSMGTGEASQQSMGTGEASQQEGGGGGGSGGSGREDSQQQATQEKLAAELSQEDGRETQEGPTSPKEDPSGSKGQPQSKDTVDEGRGEEGEEEEEEEEEDDEEWPPKFPTTLEGFGYAFNDKGQLRQIANGEPFLFEVKKGNKAYNQRHYEALGEILTETVYQLLETEGGLQRVFVPENFKAKEPLSFFFTSPDAMTNPDKLLVLIHGSGVVRAGQWSRRLIMNDCLDSGTQLPFIKRAISEGYGVMVLNTNRNREVVGDKKVPIRHNSTPEQHAEYVWKHFVTKAKAKRVDIIAHSFGGVVTVSLAVEFAEEFQKRVHRIAFTDSVHDLDSYSFSARKIRRWITNHAVNWVSSSDPVNTDQTSFRGDVTRISAGTTKHEETSWFAFESIFAYLSSPDQS